MDRRDALKSMLATMLMTGGVQGQVEYGPPVLDGRHVWRKLPNETSLHIEWDEIQLDDGLLMVDWKDGKMVAYQEFTALTRPVGPRGTIQISQGHEFNDNQERTA